MTAADLIAMLHARYQPPEWALLDELHDSTGAGATRRFDAVAFNCWPSGRFVRLGFEVKVSRSDFARELADHAKRAALEEQCHQVFFVVPPGVCLPREVPEPWGLLQVAGDSLRALVKPRHREVGPVAEPLAVCAIRRLKEQEIARQKRHYTLDGVELTQEDLDALVERKLERRSAALDQERQALAKQEQEITAMQREVERDAGRWWEIWRMVQNAADGRSSWRPMTREPPTKEQLLEAVALIRDRGRADLTGNLRAARASLDATLAAIERAEFGSGPATAQIEELAPEAIRAALVACGEADTRSRRSGAFIPRLGAWVVLREAGLSLPRIAILTGHDHSTVSSGLKRAADYTDDPNYLRARAAASAVLATPRGS